MTRCWCRGIDRDCFSRRLAWGQGAPTSWADVEGRIQYAYYTEDARALNGMLNSLKPKAVEGENKNTRRRTPACARTFAR